MHTRREFLKQAPLLTVAGLTAFIEGCRQAITKLPEQPQEELKTYNELKTWLDKMSYGLMEERLLINEKMAEVDFVIEAAYQNLQNPSLDRESIFRDQSALFSALKELRETKNKHSKNFALFSERIIKEAGTNNSFNIAQKEALKMRLKRELAPNFSIIQERIDSSIKKLEELLSRLQDRINQFEKQNYT